MTRIGRPKLYDKEIKTAITNKTARDLERFAERDNRTVSDLVRSAIAAHLKRLARREA
jgi:hypothetical protein